MNEASASSTMTWLMMSMHMKRMTRCALVKMCISPAHRAAAMKSLLHTMVGAPEQFVHRDFDLHDFVEADVDPEGNVPYPVGVLISLQRGSSLVVDVDGTKKPSPFRAWAASFSEGT